MEISVIKNIGECEVLWEKFSPKKTFFELWDYRICFWEVFQFQPYFVVLRKDSEEVGLLPLWFNHELSKYFWFGDVGDGADWQESNDFWVGEPAYALELLQACPVGTVLNSVKAEAVELVKDRFDFLRGDPKFLLRLEGINSVEDYLMRLDKKLRSNLRRDQKRVEALQPQIQIDNFGDFAELVELNKGRFADSPFHDGRIVQVFEKIVELGRGRAAFKSRMISARIDGKIAAVDLIFIFGDVYYAMICGSDISVCNGIGNYMNLLDVKDALDLGVSIVDFADGTADSHKRKLFTSVEHFRMSI